ncbi:hypothetical protein BGZ65_005611 [Modicella reniformis]|uniref:Peptidase A1 domain-containing protein n=1 Tax=Modicella reniformis TaxID=1440133 RepID=A0A9P6MKJ0_9FUNG|nr:hypothetical protein BGZ65_005611 [Modicella reniformis]
MKITISAAIVLAFSSIAASIITVPIDVHLNPINLNPKSLTKRYLNKRAGVSTTAPLTNVENDILYTIPLSLGTPPQIFNVAIDTGSPITWVSSSSCLAGGCVNTNKFNCAASSSCKALPNSFNASYVSGEGVSGTYIAETYTIGSLRFLGVAGIVTQNSAQLPPTVDGIMGLWYYAPGSQIPILNMLRNTTALTENMISVYLEASTVKSGNAPGGEITFGGVNPARFTGQISYVNCIADRPWSIPVGGMTVGNTKINVVGAIASIDTGTTAMLMPQVVADAINGAIPGAIKAPQQGGLWFLPCSGNTPVTITFGAFTGDIPYTSLAMQSTRQKTSQGDYCLSAAMFPTGQIVTIEEWLIGDAFLKNVYSVYDFGTNAATGGRIGFAQLASRGSGGNGGTSGGSGGGSSGGSGGSSSGSVKTSSSMFQVTTALVAVSALFVMF